MSRLETFIIIHYIITLTKFSSQALKEVQRDAKHGNNAGNDGE